MIPKINQDLESARHQKNMTDTQKRNDTYIKEGIIVNSYVKDPLLEGPKASILDETCDTLVISNKNMGCLNCTSLIVIFDIDTGKSFLAQLFKCNTFKTCVRTNRKPFIFNDNEMVMGNLFRKLIQASTNVTHFLVMIRN